MAGPGGRGHAPADAGLADRRAVRRLPGPISIAGSHGLGDAGTGPGRLERPRLQPPRSESPRCGHRDRGERLAADRRGPRAVAGIGPYSARAIASIAFGHPVGAVDTNVRRWLVRRFAADPAKTGELQDLADRLAAPSKSVDPLEAGTWTHATMEFGARVIPPRAPRCPVLSGATGLPIPIRPAAGAGSPPIDPDRRRPRSAWRPAEGADCRARSSVQRTAGPGDLGHRRRRARLRGAHRRISSRRARSSVR